MVMQSDRHQEQRDTANMPNDGKKSVFSRIKDLLPEQTSIPKLTADAWKTVILKVIERLPPWGLAAVIWTAVVLLGVWLIIREFNQ